jgi:hypothetical protein
MRITRFAAALMMALMAFGVDVGASLQAGTPSVASAQARHRRHKKHRKHGRRHHHKRRHARHDATPEF